MTRTMQAGDLCLVTGASGYLASWIAKKLLEDGFRVRGTIRSLDDSQRLATLRAILPGADFVAADLRSSKGWREAVAGCRWIFHVASPQAVATEKDRTRGAIEGTRHLLTGSFAEPSVEKVVLTSSEAAIAYGFPRSKQRFTETDWTDLSSPAGRIDYFRSKTLAEKLAWDFVRDPAQNPRGVALTTICPGFILGPSLVPWGRYSLESLKGLVEGKTPVVLDMITHIVDVRDCAAMHIAAANHADWDGRRMFSFSIAAKMGDMAASVRRQFASLGYNARPWTLPNALVRAMSLVYPDAAGIVSKLGHPNRYDTLWPDAFSYATTELDPLIRASVESMLAHGWIEPKRAAA